MGTTWVLVADASRARLYAQAELAGPLGLVQEFEHAESRMKGEQLASDRPGRIFRDGGGHGAYAEPSDPKAYEAQRFAQELAQILDKGRVTNSYQKLVVVAPPHFHGELNLHLNAHTREKISSRIEKDYTQLPPKELAERMSEHRQLNT